MKRLAMNLMLGALLSGTVSMVFAQNEVNDRERNQQQRIGQGVESGSLTAGETAHLEKQEAGINKEVRQDRKANGGKLTPQEHAQVNRQQNRESNRIYRDKHNGKTQ
jgi:methionine-rich copper-binding protein CopC